MGSPNDCDGSDATRAFSEWLLPDNNLRQSPAALNTLDDSAVGTRETPARKAGDMMTGDLNFDITSNKRFYLDGGPNAANGGDTYLYQPGDNEMRFYSGGTYAFAVTPTLVGTGTDFAIANGKKLYLDSSTYVSAPTTNVMSFAVGSDPQVMQLTPTGATITSGNDLTMSGGNIAMAPLKTVDGVDVSELKNTVDSHGITINVHGATINDLAAHKVFAYGRATLSNVGDGATVCSGYGIKATLGGHGYSTSDVRCNFQPAASNTNYSVVVTATSGGGCIYGGIMPQVTSKTTTDFHINTYCNVTGPTSAVTNVDFVVFEQ